MPEYLDDPSVLTKDKLKSELLAHNVELPSGNQTKDVYVQLYLKNLTAQNNQHDTAASLDAFSSDEELPPPVVVSSRSRSSGRKAVRKTDKVRAAELDVTELTDQDLKDELLKHGVDAGPIVATTRKLYEKKLQKLLDNGPVQVTQLVVTEIQVNHNGNSESEVYSDKEDEVTPEPEPEPIPEPEPEPEPVPVVERPIRSRGKTPVTTRTSSSSKHKVTEQLLDEDEDPVLLVKRRSRRLSSRPVMVPEDLRPVLADQVQPKRRVSQRLESPARSEPPSTSSRPAQLQVEDLQVHPLRPRQESSGPAALLDTALLEDPVQVPEPSGPAVRRSVREDPSPQTAAKPSRSSSPQVHLTRVHVVPLRSRSNISPVKQEEDQQSQSDQFGSEPSRRERPPLVVLKQQKISGFLSACGAVRTLGSVSTLTRDESERQQVEKIAASEPTPKVDESDVLKELFPNDINSPTGITATCRRPIRGAAGRPIKPSDLWNDENVLFSPKTAKSSSSSSSSSFYTESHIINRVSSLPPSTSSSSSFTSSSSSSRPLSAAPPAAQTKAAPRRMSLWVKLLLLAVVAAFLFLVYQAMETDTANPFESATPEVASDAAA